MILLFDLNGTLTDPSPIGLPWDQPELGVAVLEAAVQTAAVDALTGEYRPFKEHVEAAVRRRVAERRLDDRHIDRAVAAAGSLPAFPEVSEGLSELSRAGHRLAVLTNSGAEGGRGSLEAAGIAEAFEAVLGVDAVDTYKPHPAAYRHACEQLGAAPEDIMLVAAHQWDITGASRSGLRTAWLARPAQRLSAVGAEPDIQASDLLDLHRRLSDGS